MLRYNIGMNANHHFPPMSRLVRRLLPLASPMELEKAQVAYERFIAVLYRICERLDDEAREAERDKISDDGTVNATNGT